MINRYDRLNRIKYHFKRWDKEKVFLVYSRLSELNKTWEYLTSMDNTHTNYVIYVTESKQQSYFIKSSIPPIIQKSSRYFFPINFLRDIVIESIKTTHYVYVDADVFLSSKLSYTHKYIENAFFDAYSSAHIFKTINVYMIYPLFTSATKVLKKCRQIGQCEYLYKYINNHNSLGGIVFHKQKMN